MIRIVMLFIVLTRFVIAQSQSFPPTATALSPSNFITTPSDTFYCSPTGNNSTGDGSIGTPWLDLRGTSGLGVGDLIYLRGGNYPSSPESWSDGSENQTTTNGEAANRIVITNYPGEIAYWESDSVLFTFGGDYQVLLGTAVSDSMGIQFDGGVSIDNGADNCQMSGVYIKHGGEYGSNPALFTYPHNTYNLDGLTISYCHFDSSLHNNAGGQGDRMVAIRLFTTQNFTAEYNLFTDCSELYQGGAIYFKDASSDATVRYNKFINCEGGISFSVQGNNFIGLEAYGNLSYNSDCFIYMVSDLGNSDEINIYNNVVLDVITSFYVYMNADNDSYSECGNVYNNVIDGTAFSRGWHPNSADEQNIPDLFDYNLWYSSGDQNTPSDWTIPSAYHDNAVVSNNAVTYNSTTMTATVANDYAGIGQGRNGGNIGGFTWNDSSSPTYTATLTLNGTDSVDISVSDFSSDTAIDTVAYPDSTTFIHTGTGVAWDTTLALPSGYNYKYLFVKAIDDSANVNYFLPADDSIRYIESSAKKHVTEIIGIE